MAIFPCNGAVQESTTTIFCRATELFVHFRQSLSEFSWRIPRKISLADTRVDRVQDDSGFRHWKKIGKLAHREDN